MASVSRGRVAALVLGLGFGWFYYSPTLFAHFLAGFDDPSLSQVASTLHVAMLSATCLAAARFWQIAERLACGHRKAVLTVMLSSAAGSALLYLAPLTPYPQASMLLALAVLSISHATLMLAWAHTVSLLEERLSLFVVLCSSVLYAVVAPVDHAAPKVAITTCTLITCVSSVLWYATGTPAGEQVGRTPPPPTAFPHGTMALFFLFVMGGRFIAGMLAYVDNLGFASAVIKCTTIAITATAALALLSRYRNTAVYLQKLCLFIGFLFFIGPLSYLALRAPAAQFSSGVTVGTVACIETTAYLVLLKHLRVSGLSPFVAFGIGFVALKTIPLAFQRFLVRTVANLLDMTMTQSVVFVLTVVMVMIAGVFVLLGITLKNLTPTGAPEQTGTPETPSATETPFTAQTRLSFEQSCELIAEQAKLSPRESQIMLYLAQGNSLKKTSQKLGLAFGTAQWYAKSLYKKLEVHSKQELIDRVHGAMSPER